MVQEKKVLQDSAYSGRSRKFLPAQGMGQLYSICQKYMLPVHDA